MSLAMDGVRISGRIARFAAGISCVQVGEDESIRPRSSARDVNSKQHEEEKKKRSKRAALISIIPKCRTFWQCGRDQMNREFGVVTIRLSFLLITSRFNVLVVGVNGSAAESLRHRVPCTLGAGIFMMPLTFPTGNFRDGNFLDNCFAVSHNVCNNVCTLGAEKSDQHEVRCWRWQVVNVQRRPGFYAL